MPSTSLSIRQSSIHTSNINAPQKSTTSTPNATEIVLQGVLQYATQLGKSREKLVDLRRELADLENKRRSMSVRVPFDERTNAKELSDKIRKIEDDLTTLARDKAEKEKIIVALESELEKQEAILGVRTSALESVKAKKEDEEKNVTHQQKKLHEDLMSARASKKNQSDQNAAEIAIYRNEKTSSVNTIGNSERALKRRLEKETSKIGDALLRRPIEELDKSEHLDLTPFLEGDMRQGNRQRIVLLTNYISSLHLAEESHYIRTRPPGIGAAVVAAIAAAVISQVHRKNSPFDLKTAVTVIAEALFATAILVIISRLVKSPYLMGKLLEVKIERLMPEKKENTTESDIVDFTQPLATLGATKSALYFISGYPRYSTQYRNKLAGIFMSVVNPKTTREILTGFQSEIERSLTDLLRIKNRLADETEEAKDELEDNVKIFDQHSALDNEKIKDIAVKALMAFKQQKRSATGEKKAFLTEAITFLEKDKASLLNSLQSLVREFSRETFLAIANDPVLNKHVQTIAFEQSKQASLEQAIRQVKNRSPGQIVVHEDGSQIDFYKSRIGSLQQKYDRMKSTNDQYRAKCDEIGMRYKKVQESHATLTEDMNTLEDELKKTRILQREEKDVLDHKQAQTKAPAEALDKEILQISATIDQMTGEEDEQLKNVLNNRSEIGKLVEQLIERKALQRVIDTHFRQTLEQLKEHKKRNGYASNYLSLDALLESLVHAHQAFQIYDAATVTSGIKSYRRLYARSGKTIAEGMSSYAAKLISSGTAYDMDEKNRKITHIHPFIPRLSQSLNDSLQNHGSVEQTLPQGAPPAHPA